MGTSGSSSSAPRGKAKARRRKLGLTLDCAAIAADTSIIAPLSCRKASGQSTVFRSVCSVVSDFICLGGAKVALDLPTLQSYGITHVINCVSHKCQCAFPKQLCYLPLALADSSKQDMTQYLYLVIGFIEAVRRGRGRVLVHCMEGISRSAAFVVAYMMWSRGLQVDVALKELKASRTVVEPNANFLFQLSDWNINRPLYLKPGSTSVFRVERHKLRIRGMNSPPYNSGGALPLLYGPLSRLSTDMFAPMDALRAQEIDHTYIVVAHSGIFLWTSKKLPQEDMDAAKLAVKQLQCVEKRDCDSVRVVQAGNEPPEFWNSFAYLPSHNGVRVTPHLRTSRVEPATSHFQKLKI